MVKIKSIITKEDLDILRVTATLLVPCMVINFTLSMTTKCSGKLEVKEEVVPVYKSK